MIQKFNEHSDSTSVYDQIYQFMDVIYKDGITDYDAMCEEAFKKWDKRDPELKDMVWDAAATYLDDMKFLQGR